MEGSAQESVGTQSSWLRCYRCWSQNLEVQLHYEAILKVDADTGEAVEPVEEVQEAVSGRSQRRGVSSGGPRLPPRF